MWKGLFKDDLQRSFIIWETEEHNLHATVMGGSRLFVPEQRWRKSLNEPDVQLALQSVSNCSSVFA